VGVGLFGSMAFLSNWGSGGGLFVSLFVKMALIGDGLLDHLRYIYSR